VNEVLDGRQAALEAAAQACCRCIWIAGVPTHFFDSGLLSMGTPSSRQDSSQARPAPQLMERQRVSLADAGHRAGCAIEEGEVWTFSSSSDRDAREVEEPPTQRFKVTDVRCGIRDRGMNAMGP
jgi:hypothetical protein